jgi:hypothetical protein
MATNEENMTRYEDQEQLEISPFPTPLKFGPIGGTPNKVFGLTQIKGEYRR